MNGTPQFNPKGLKSITAAKPVDVEAPERIGLDHDPRIERRAKKRRLLRLARETAAAEQIGRLPDESEDIILIMTGRFHGFDILSAILQLAGEDVHCESLWVATLGFNRTQTDTLAEMIDTGQVGKLTFLVSHMFSEKNAGEYNYLDQTLTDRGQRLANSRNHAKLMLIRLSDGRHIVTHGSLNLRRCNSFEQLAITQDKRLFEFFQKYIEDVIRGAITA